MYGLAEKGFGCEQMAKMQKIIGAAKSDSLTSWRASPKKSFRHCGRGGRPGQAGAHRVRPLGIPTVSIPRGDGVRPITALAAYSLPSSHPERGVALMSCIAASNRSITSASFTNWELL